MICKCSTYLEKYLILNAYLINRLYYQISRDREGYLKFLWDELLMEESYSSSKDDTRNCVVISTEMTFQESDIESKWLKVIHALYCLPIEIKDYKISTFSEQKTIPIYGLTLPALEMTVILQLLRNQRIYLSLS